ncbi:MAG TPA: MFS transporter [Candidatus Baltobacteraceae bacterium]|jgi:OFA family oxalate/formate antiporter-like MFS transporter|nr:MFS transporter [Candidatus Baltobacteraceae bacterium]
MSKTSPITPIAGMLVLLGPGALLAFTLFSQPLNALFGWSASQASWNLTLALLSFGIGSAVGGRLVDRYHAQLCAIMGSMLWGLGNVVAGLATLTVGGVGFSIGYGLLGGVGCGIACVAGTTALLNALPKRRGLAGGLAAGGFGLGATIYGYLLLGFTPYPVIERSATAFLAQKASGLVHGIGGTAALGAPGINGLMLLLVVSGIAFALFGTIVSLPLADAVPNSASASGSDVSTFTTREMLSNQSFFVLWSLLFLNTTAGLIVLSNAVPIIAEFTKFNSLGVATLFIGVAAFNGFGQLIFGAISDVIGRKPAFLIQLGLNVLALFFLQGSHDLTLIGLLLATIYFCFGGLGIAPGLLADYFGLRHFSANYGILLTAWGAAGLFAPWFSATLKDATGSYAAVLQPMAILFLICMLLPLMVEAPEKIKALTSRKEP